MQLIDTSEPERVLDGLNQFPLGRLEPRDDVVFEPAPFGTLFEVIKRQIEGSLTIPTAGIKRV